MGAQYRSIHEAWERILEERDSSFLKIPVAGTSQVLSYRLSSFYRRAVRVSNALRNELGAAEGDRIALLTRSANDVALLLHGIWLGRLVAIPIELDLPGELIAKILVNSKATAVIFPPEFTAKVASIFSKATSVRHWVISGTSKALNSVPGVRRLEELVVNAATTLPPLREEMPDCDALIALTAGSRQKPSGMAFSQKQLLQAGALATSMYPAVQDDEGLAWTSFRWMSLHGVLHSFLLPLLTGTPALLNDDFDVRRFWEQVQADGVTVAIINQQEMRAINKMGRPRSSGLLEKLQLWVYTHEPYAQSMFETFSRRFGVTPRTCYTHSEAGGLVTVFPSDLGDAETKEFMYDFDVPCSGVSVSGVDFVICDSQGTELGEEELGEVLISSPASMRSYAGTHPGGSRFRRDGYLHTGDNGFYIIDGKGRKALFIMGRMSDLIVRKNRGICPSRIENILQAFEGIEYACAIGFPNIAAGYEVGAYVIPTRTAQLTSEGVLHRLKSSLEWYECPKVVIIGARPKDGGLPRRTDLQEHFETYYDIDYSHGPG